MSIRKTLDARTQTSLGPWRRKLLDRRAFLLRMAGGSLAALFPLPVPAADETFGTDDAWALIAAVQEHIFPSEPAAPGARDINALGYLQFVVGDDNLDAEHRAFLLRGAEWVQ